jgi:hypothetical protein
MKKTILFILVFAQFFSCKQSITPTPETVDLETVHSERKYEYVDSLGARIIIENSVPRGVKYTDPQEKEYARLLFWTQITNETENPLECKIDFPAYAYEVPSLPGRYFKILVPHDTMTFEKVALPDYGMKHIKSFIDTHIESPSSLKRTINPKESSGFYVVILFDIEVPGPTRTALFMKGQNLFYKVTRYSGKQGVSFVDEKEINCGRIHLKNLATEK